MRRTASIALLLLASLSLAGQALPERKVVVRDGQFWYATIDEMQQVATLHTGSLTDPISAAKHLALPAGRNYMEPVNPFCWQVEDAGVYCVNFLDFPLNDRNESIKLFPLTAIQEADKAPPVIELLHKGAEWPQLVRNEPYVWMQRRNNVMENFFFDLLVEEDGTLRMAICNAGEMTLWSHSGKEWTHSDPFPFGATSAFSLFLHGKSICLLSGDGGVHEWQESGLTRIPTKSSAQALAGGILIVNEDEGTVRCLPATHFDTDLPLQALLEQYSIRVL